MTETIQRALTHLSYRQRRMVVLHHGLEGDKPWTLERLAELFKCQKERARQDLLKAVAALREGPYADTLRAELLEDA